MLHKCPVCGQDTLEVSYDNDQNIPFGICQNKKCPQYGEQQEAPEIEQ